MAEQHSPLEQFEIKSIVEVTVGGLDLSFTNSSIFMAIASLGIGAFMVMGMKRQALVPGRWQCTVEVAYEFVAGLLRDTVGPEGRKYFPIVFTIFMFILVGNLLGMVPYSFTFTSHIIVTFAMALAVFIGVTVLGVMKHGLHFLALFVPPGTAEIPVAVADPDRDHLPICRDRSACRSGCSPTCSPDTPC